MLNADALLERRDVLREVRGVLANAGRGSGRVLMIEGEAGIGKTAVLQSAAKDAEGLGMKVLSARGGVLERSLGHGVARELFETEVVRAPMARRRALLRGPASIAEDALLSGEPAGSVSEPQVHHGLYWLAANLAEHAALLIAVDDAQWCDDATLRWLLYLTRRLEWMPVAVLVAVRRGEPGAPDGLLALIASEPVCEVHELARLSERGTVELLERLAGMPVDEDFGRACHEWTGGNPFMVRELGLELKAEGLEPSSEAVDRMRRLSPGAVSRSVLLRLSRLPREAAMFASAASVLGSGAAQRHVAVLAGLNEAEGHTAADILAGAGILEPGPELRFSHPLLAGVIYDDLPSARRAAEHRQAAEILHGDSGAPGLVAAHLLRCDPAGDPWVIARLRTAAASDIGRGAPDAAVVLLRRALAEPPARASRPELLHELGRAEGLVRDPSALADLEQALRLSEDAALRAKASEDLTALLVIAGVWDAAVAVVEQALAELGDDEPETAVRLEAWRAGTTAFDPRFVGQFDQRSPHLDELAMTGGAAARPLAVLLAGVAGWRGQPRDTVLRLVERGLDGGRFVEDEEGDIWLAQSVTALVAVDELDRAQELVERMLAAARRRGSVLGTSAASSFQGWVYAQRGDLARAEADIRGGFELAREHELTFAIPSILRYAIDVLTERPGLSDLAALAEGIALPPAFMRTAFGALLLDARARVRLAGSESAVAIEDLRQCGAILDALGLRNPVLCSWRSTLAVALRDRDRQEAGRLVAEELDIARATGLPRAEGVALRAAGLVEGGERGVELLRDAASTLKRSPSRLEHGRALTDLGAALRRAGRRADARNPLGAGLELARACGAQRLAERAEQELRATGARPRAILRSGLDSLTPSELRVCQMAARGLSNPEIAHALFVTRGTIESQLHSSYTKLGIRSRRELTSHLQDV
jgi:DNA-binding CsgD family transcriptional regulator/tetratricopeptide (TPR) repeat protein